MPKRQRYLWVCTNERPLGHPSGSCATEGSREVLEELKKQAYGRGLKNRVRICGSTCLDLCWMGPAVAVMPDHVFYGPVKLGDVPEIVDSLEHGTVVDRLVVKPGEFDAPKKDV